MIQFIRGTLVSIEEDRVIVDVNGVGCGIFMSVQAMALLPQTGTEVKIHTYLSVKEDAMQLYGFLTRDDLMIFRLLIGVNGIGPKGGQAILSVLQPDDLRFAVLAGDVKAISAAPGIGKKTAEKLILELRDKLKIGDVLEHQTSGGALSGSAPKESGHIQSEAVQALTALGYGSTEALKAVKQVLPEEQVDVESVLKRALKYLL